MSTKIISIKTENLSLVRSIWNLCIMSCGNTKKAHYKKNFIICIAFPSDRLLEFFYLWPLQQWISSLVGLIVLYAFTTSFYNKRLRRYGLEMSFSFQAWMIFSDLFLNLIIGLYYMQHRNTILGALTITCPISLSPAIFIIELIILIAIKEYQIWDESRKSK